jgi:hypothetical protein
MDVHVPESGDEISTGSIDGLCTQRYSYPGSRVDPRNSSAIHEHRTIGQHRPPLGVYDGDMCDGQHGYRRRATASGGEGEELEKGTDSGDHDAT